MEGPFKVLRNLGNSHYLLKDLVDKKEEYTFHVKKYLFNSAFTSPQGVEARDLDEFFVEAILNHRGNFNTYLHDIGKDSVIPKEFR